MVLRKSAQKFENAESADDLNTTAGATAVMEKPAAAPEAAAADAGEPTATVVAPATEAEAKAEMAAAKEEAAPAAAPEAKAATSTAVAPAAKSSLTTVLAKKFQPALADFENVIPAGSVDFNTFVRVTVGLDGFSDSEGNELGDEIHMQLMSFNSRWVVTPGVQDAEATELVKYSADGKTIDGTDGDSIFDYLEYLKKSEGYEKAAIKEYLAIYGFLTHASQKEGKQLVFGEIPPEDRQIIELQVPPQSRALFQRYQIEAGVKISQGIIPATDVLVCRQDKVEGKNQKYAQIKFNYK